METVRHSDVIVVGLGTAGAATCMELARRGNTVLGLDAFEPPHNAASHHGESRSIRRAYMESTAYVPMAMRSWDLWRKLERDSGGNLLVETGNLTIGPPDSPAVGGFLKSARAYDIPFEHLSAADIRTRWPQLNPPKSYIAGLETKAGILFPELAVQTLLTEAKRAGARLHVNEPVLRWEEQGDVVLVHTPVARYETGRLLLAAGARNKQLVGRLGGALTIKRVPVCWVVPPHGKNYHIGSFPVNFWQITDLRQDGLMSSTEVSALPCTRSGGMVKVAPHNRLADCDPDNVQRQATAEEINRTRIFMERCIPSLATQDMRSEVCMYTLTPDRDFWIGPLSGHPNVFIVALSGHGFKFAPVLGEILSDLLEGQNSTFDISMFDPARAS